MKKFLLIALIISTATIAQAQIGKGILKKAKEKIEKPGEKGDKKKEDKKEENKNTEEKSGNGNNGTQAETKKDTVAPQPASIKAYSKYDFVPGEKVIGFEDFSTGSIGDFPAGWNTSGSAEIVTIEGKPGRWLWITRPGVFVPEFTDKYPDNFTFEFDLLHGVPIRGAHFDFVMAQLESLDKPQHWTLAGNRFKTGLYTANSDAVSGTVTSEIRKNSESQSANQFHSDLLSDKNNPVHVSVWRQKERVRIYVNQEKVWDIPKAIAPDAKLNALLFNAMYAEKDIQHYISNLRLAVGAPDSRNKFLTEGKWVTHGILFDVSSATIKAESYGTLKEIANVLKENAGVKVKIVGHTDSDGDEAKNMDLSKRRATSVKDALAKEFGIDESLMQTDGMGESKPIDKNDTPAGKANNRRVEFIKL